MYPSEMIERVEQAYKDVQDDSFIIYAQGICNASVCSSLPLEEVQQRMASLPTGVGLWTYADGEAFASGQPNPRPCDQKPETHQHYLFHC